uniref:Uncharacterized protein n=2 Tax=Brugia TaxID=6278 RepID=A8Q7G9_BRUMA
MTEDWHSVQVKHILDFILNEIHVQEVKVSARLSQQLAITEVHFYGTNQHPVVREQLNVNLSSEAIKEKEVLGFMDRVTLTFFPVEKNSVLFNPSLHTKERNTSEGEKLEVKLVMSENITPL